jgi:hypothetical protein
MSKRKFRFLDLALLPFGVCVLFLLGLGKLFGLTYKQISVVFNLWVQGGILMLSGIAPLAAMLYRMYNDGVTTIYIIGVVALAVYAYPYIRGFVWMLRHYHLPFNDAFDLCVKDLRHLAVRWRITYQMVNLLIFLLAFLALLGLNGYITYLILY